MQKLPNLCFKLSTEWLGPWESACRGPSCELCETLNVQNFPFNFHVNKHFLPNQDWVWGSSGISPKSPATERITWNTDGETSNHIHARFEYPDWAFVSICFCAFHRWLWSCPPIERTNMTVWKSSCVWTAPLPASVWCLAPSANLKRLWLWPPRLLCRWTAKWEESCGV